MITSTSVWGAQHPNPGQNIQQMGALQVVGWSKSIFSLHSNI